MKYILMLSAVIFVSPVADASETVCASADLYYKSSSYSGGARPYPGMVTGETIIVYQGQVLLNEERIQGHGRYTIPAYKVDFPSAPESTLEETGNRMEGTSVTRQQISLFKVDAIVPSAETEITTESALCSKSWSRLRP